MIPSALSLVDRYRPATFDDVVGQDDIVGQLRVLASEPISTALLFTGDSGTGKTSVALALAAALGVDVAEEECGGLYEIKSGDQTADAVRALILRFRCRPMMGSGWRVVVVNECDRMSEAVSFLWLDILESLPPETLIVFTTNNPEKLDRRFRTRCEVMPFTSDPHEMRASVQRRISDIWFRETGRSDAPRVETLDGAIEDDKLSIRQAIQAMNPLIRRAKSGVTPVATATPVKPKRASPTDLPWPVIRERFASGETIVALANEYGLKRQTMYARLWRSGAFVSTPKHATA